MGATPAPAAWSTAAVDQDDAFAYWRDVICEAFVQLAARPVAPGPFAGRIEHTGADDLALSLVAAGPQQVDRTPGLIRQGHEDYVLASIQLDGQGVVTQGDRRAALSAGSMAFYDSTRPYTLRFDDPFRQLVVQVPTAALTRRRTDGATAVALPADGPGRLVADFFVGLARQGTVDPGLVPHALGLLDFALGLAAGAATEEPGAALRERVHRVVARAATDQDVGVDAIAAACRVSRRTLYRVLATEGETVAGLLRRERVRRARALLRGSPALPLPVVARRSGFAGETQLHRTFRAETGTTPAAYRAGR
ncbi:helix-turn-helix domain-containing protein [Actinomycetospora straminea]|uniref:Helix-turn-helix domain-containing protein n=1 Tax=Actinomycetospora straminea TaxID=663607 RepID=A0ABP9ELU1_9PSEU|nr:helix-turn-helix domain-containing protein [Actinomycetospora straminea]MDD7933297.1 helix-turn-helix domain-containing protein [Actinomycetospora straminea]